MNAVDLLCLGASDGQAAKVVGVSRQTVNAWKNRNPYFRAALNQRREAVWGAAKDKLRSALPLALDRLAQEIKEGPHGWRAALRLIEISQVAGNLGVTRQTDADAILDEEVRKRRPDTMQRLLDGMDGGPITAEERRAVLEELCGSDDAVL